MVIYPDKIISVECLCKFGQGKTEFSLSKTTGNPELDEILTEVSFFFPLFSEYSFAWLIDKQSDGSESYDEYGDDYERIRLEIIQFEDDMRKKYLL